MSTLGYHILRLCSWKHAPKEKHAPALKRLCFETKDRFLKKGFQFAALQCCRYIYIYVYIIYVCIYVYYIYIYILSKEV